MDIDIWMIILGTLGWISLLGGLWALVRVSDRIYPKLGGSGYCGEESFPQHLEPETIDWDISGWDTSQETDVKNCWPWTRVEEGEVNMNNGLDDLVTLRDVAERAGVSIHTARAWRQLYPDTPTPIEERTKGKELWYDWSDWAMWLKLTGRRGS